MDGQRLFTSAYVTLSAYDAGTGAQLWVVCLDVDDDGVDADSPGAVRIGDGVVCYWTPGGARCVDAASGARLDGREVVGPQAEDGGRCFGAGANVELRACFGDMTLVNAHLGLRVLRAGEDSQLLHVAVPVAKRGGGALLVAGDRAYATLSDGTLLFLGLAAVVGDVIGPEDQALAELTVELTKALQLPTPTGSALRPDVSRDWRSVVADWFVRDATPSVLDATGRE
jgi:outer membrane protein assembly factor BamB